MFFIRPVRRDPHFRHLIHVFGADLDFNGNAVRASLVLKAIAVRFGNGNIVALLRHETRLIETVHLAEVRISRQLGS